MSNDRDYDDEEAIGNYWTDTIYPSREFKDLSGKFFTIVTEDDDSTSIEYHPPHPSRNRIKISVTFINAKNDIKEITIKKFKEYTTKGVPRWEEQRWGPHDPMKFSHFSFEKLLSFLKFLTELNLVDLNQRRIALREDNEGSLDEETITKIKSLLKSPDTSSLVEEILRDGTITSHDIVNIGYRKKQLDIFRDLLTKPESLEKYRQKNGIKSNQLEKIWQYFFEQNEWIFGLGLDYRYLNILQREAHVSSEDVAGKEGVATDFLLGATNFTVLVEIKRPDTELFTKSKNRSNSWRLSSKFTDAVSQILEQKASWQIKSETNQNNNYNDEGNLITQKTVDPKCILIIGSDSEFRGTQKEKSIKLRTFELFRRDSRNIEILTFDELYNRAEFIIGRAVRNSA